MGTAMDGWLGIFRRERGWTRRLVAALPDDVFDWRPHPDAFSCGELVRHLVLAERFWRRLLVDATAGAAWDPFGYSGSGLERHAAFRRRNLESAQRLLADLTSFTPLLAHWEIVEAETVAALSGFTAEQLDGVVVDHPVAALRLPLREMLHYMLSHEIHHRGQLSAYAKMLGLSQPPVLAEA